MRKKVIHLLHSSYHFMLFDFILEFQYMYLICCFSRQIGALKSLTIDIGAEVKEHNRLLRETDDLFDSVQGGLSNAMNKVLS